MENENKIIVTYGLQKCDQVEIEKVIDENSILIKEIEDIEELLNGNYFTSLVNLNELNDTELKELVEYYLKVDGGLSQKIFIGKDKSKLFKECSNILIFESFDIFKNDMIKIIEKAYSKAKRADNNVSAVINVINVLNQIESKSGISTKELSRAIDKNENAIKRYIEMLNIAGKSIFYNYEEEGWYIKK